MIIISLFQLIIMCAHRDSTRRIIQGNCPGSHSVRSRCISVRSPFDVKSPHYQSIHLPLLPPGLAGGGSSSSPRIMSCLDCSMSTECEAAYYKTKTWTLLVTDWFVTCYKERKKERKNSKSTALQLKVLNSKCYLFLNAEVNVLVVQNGVLIKYNSVFFY